MSSQQKSKVEVTVIGIDIGKTTFHLWSRCSPLCRAVHEAFSLGHKNDDRAKPDLRWRLTEPFTYAAPHRSHPEPKQF